MRIFNLITRYTKRRKIVQIPIGFRVTVNDSHANIRVFELMRALPIVIPNTVHMSPLSLFTNGAFKLIDQTLENRNNRGKFARHWCVANVERASSDVSKRRVLISMIRTTRVGVHSRQRTIACTLCFERGRDIDFQIPI